MQMLDCSRPEAGNLAEGWTADAAVALPKAGPSHLLAEVAKGSMTPLQPLPLEQVSHSPLLTMLSDECAVHTEGSRVIQGLAMLDSSSAYLCHKIFLWHF